MKFTESQIQSLAPDITSLKAGKALSGKNKWIAAGYSSRALWGEIKGSGTKPYQTQVDINNIAFKCSCPSRKFPCKHGIGLMLLWTNDTASVLSCEEPSWVAEWIEKRFAKAEKPIEPKELTEEDIVKSEKAKQKRADDRMISVQSGVDEINLWISDLIRTGILQLQQKEYSFFGKTASRMVDSKASGLASMVKSLGKINYSTESHLWQNEVMTILSKMYLLTRGFENLSNLSVSWQYSLKSLIGWSQSSKELLADETALVFKDTWIVIGQETTEEDDIIVQRSWLLGLNQGKTALILNFGTRFAPLDISVVNGSVIEAGLIYFPSVWMQRAVIKVQNKIFKEIPTKPLLMSDFNAVFSFISDILVQYPFAGDFICAIESVRLIFDRGKYKALDKNGFIMEIHPGYNEEKIINWLAISGGDFFDITAIVRNQLLMPQGAFFDTKYILI